MTTTSRTAASRRGTITDAAVRTFARTGYHATPVAAVAAASGYSPAYVFRLFSDKLSLFIAALEACFARIRDALTEGAATAPDQTPAAVLEAMGVRYAELIADRDLLLLQVHALGAADVPEIGPALRAGWATIIELVRERSGGSDPEIQRFIAYGQLCHLIVTLDLDAVDAPWARTLTDGMTHMPPAKER